MNAVDILKNRLEGLAPRSAIILGSGLGNMVSQIENPIRIPYEDLPGFPAGNVSGHAKQIVAGTINGAPILMLSGRVHYYEQGDAAAMRPIIETLRDFGIEQLILSNTAGSLHADMPPGSVMMMTDHINWSGMNPLIGEPSDARFVDLKGTYDAGLRSSFEAAATGVGVKLHQGVYMWFSGPTFETPAEIKMSRLLGADAVGMSTVPEAILARFCGLTVAGFSVITNLGAGMAADGPSHGETKEMAPLGGQKLAAVLVQALKDDAL